MSEEKRDRFGRYLILDHLVDGGMAKICRARFLDRQADKIVAIKMVQPQYSQDEAFRQMFMDEIKLTFGLVHPNIIQTYDYGLHQGQLFVAMEYCDGRNLKEYLEKLKSRKFVFPVEISTYIITQVCQGLHYAHTYTDKLSGRLCNIIHRDISPHNIMLTYDGAVKIIDFGIAKADTNSEATRAGTIKGKLSYLAPEYLEGEKLDSSYDQFAVGITLWEMLCSRKLFKASNDLAILKKIQECKIPPPSSINPNVPKELDEIVLKALSRDRKMRYPNLDKLNRALMKFLYGHYSDFNSTDLSYFAKELFKDEIKKDREKLFEFGKIDLNPYLEDLESETIKNHKVPELPSLPKESSAQEEKVFDFGFEKEEEKKASSDVPRSIITSTQKTLRPKNTHQGPRLEKKTTQLSKSIKTRPPSKSYTQKTVLKRKEIQDENSQGSKRFKIYAAGLVLLLFLTYSYKDELSDQVATMSTPTSEESSDRYPSSEKEGPSTIRFTNFNHHSQILFINGKKVRPSILGEVEVLGGQDIVVRIQSPGRQHYVNYLRVGAGKSLEIQVPEMKRVNYGYLTMFRPCANGELIFELFGERRTEKVPFEEGRGIGFPVSYDLEGRAIASDYTVYFRRANESFERRVQFTINHMDESVDLCRLLQNN